MTADYDITVGVAEYYAEKAEQKLASRNDLAVVHVFDDGSRQTHAHITYNGPFDHPGWHQERSTPGYARHAPEGLSLALGTWVWRSGGSNGQVDHEPMDSYWVTDAMRPPPLITADRMLRAFLDHDTTPRSRAEWETLLAERETVQVFDWPCGDLQTAPSEVAAYQLPPYGHARFRMFGDDVYVEYTGRPVRDRLYPMSADR